MKIKEVILEKLDLELSEPYTIAYETVSEVVNYQLTLITDDGEIGKGIAAPDKVVTGETDEDVENSFKDFVQPCLLGQDPFYFPRIISELDGKVKSSALAMTDMALYDLVTSKLGVPLYKMLGAFRDQIATSITLGIMPLEATMKKVETFLDQGFFIIKLKGGIDVEEDIMKVKTIRKKYPTLLIRFDGNQGYKLEEALHFVRSIQSDTVEIVEQPTKVAKEQLMGIINEQSEQPIMADESLKNLSDAFHLTSNGFTDMINIKIQKVGGIQNSLHINSVAKAASNEVMVGCLDECSLGIAAGLHFALSRPNVHFADLDGHLDILNDPFKGLFELKKGILYPNNKAGLGIDKK